jgi:hypothetical protein
MAKEKEYNIIRFSQAGRRRIVKRGVSHAEAKRICSDPETSSMTARKPRGCDGDEAMQQRWHAQNKHWFYGFEEATR